MFGKALIELASKPGVYRLLEIGTWYGGGSTQAFVQGLQGTNKATCVSNATHHCCDTFVTTFEIFGPAHEHARLYHQDNPVWLIKGTTVGVEDILKESEIPHKDAHFELYYQRDLKLIKESEPQLAKYCKLLDPDVVLIDGNEYTGWGEFRTTIEHCKPKWLALHDTGTLRTEKVEAYMKMKPKQFSMESKGRDGASWSIFRVTEWQPIDQNLLHDADASPTAASKQENTFLSKILEPKGIKFIDKSLSGHCHVTNTCAKDLKVLRNNRVAMNPNDAMRRQFYEAYKDDAEMKTVDIVMCFHPAAMCELFMPLNKRLFVIASTRYELGRFQPEEWNKWNQNLKTVAADPKNVVGANNLYDAKYIEYFTGIQPVVLPSWIPMEDSFTGSSSDILFGSARSPITKYFTMKKRRAISPDFAI
eukprot:scaffold2418_cov175-Amphora_coffeaeformis.AAC.5